MIAIVGRPEGSILPVRAQPGARRSGIVGEHDGALKVAVTAAPEKGKANKAIVDVLARTLKVRKSEVQLIAGETSANKRFLIVNLSPAELERRVDSSLQRS